MINRLSLLLVKHYVAFGLGMLLVCLVIAFSFACLRSEPTPYVWHLPPGFPEPPVTKKLSQFFFMKVNIMFFN